jgi:hypothetical protein
VHPLRQNDFSGVEHLASPNRMPACPTRLACSCAAFPAKFEFKLGQAGKHAGDHAPRGIQYGDKGFDATSVVRASPRVPTQ